MLCIHPELESLPQIQDKATFLLDPWLSYRLVHLEWLLGTFGMVVDPTEEDHIIKTTNPSSV